jgi:hypothetical protein
MRTTLAASRSTASVTSGPTGVIAGAVVAVCCVVAALTCGSVVFVTARNRDGWLLSVASFDDGGVPVGEDVLR